MNITVIGGDLRVVKLAEILQKNDANLYLYGLEKCAELEKTQYIQHAQSLEDAIYKSQIIITSIPLSKDGIVVNTPYSNEKIYVEELFNLSKNKKIITGNITDQIQNYIQDNNEIIDVLKNEELTILNAIPTAEGAIQIAMEKSNITLHNSTCLVMGFGRIGKILAKMLTGIGAKVYCEARKKTDIAFIKAYGYNPIELSNLSEHLDEFDFIFNTIPYVILNESNLNLINTDCLIIDLASKPGGVDFTKARELGLKTEWALALPGKVAPKTAANYIYEVIKNII